MGHFVIRLNVLSLLLFVVHEYLIRQGNSSILIKLSVGLCVSLSVCSTLETLFSKLVANFFSSFKASARECFSQIRI